MKDYLKFVWQSAIHPTQFVDLLPAFQLVLFIMFCYAAIRAFISIYQHNKQLQNGKN
jgi:hypothetical protein